MAVDNNNTDIQLSESLLSKLTFNQKTLIETLAANPSGLLSSELTRSIAVSNKSDLVNEKLKAALENEDLELFCIRVNHEWLWGLRCKSTFSNKEGQHEHLSI